MSNEIMHLCRLCLVKDQANVPIFAEQNDRQIFVKITACLPIRVSRDDSLPKKICDSCLEKLDSLYQFWNATANAEKQLLTWLGQAVVDTEFQMIQETLPVQIEIHSIKQEELDPLDSVPENTHESFVSCPTQSLVDVHIQESVGFSESPSQFHGTEDKGFPNNRFPKVTRDYSGSAPAKRRKQVVPKLVVNNDDANKEKDVYRPSIATVIVKTEKDNECIDAEDMSKNPEINFIPSEVHSKEQSELFGMQKSDHGKILKHRTYSSPRGQYNMETNQSHMGRKTEEKFFKNKKIINNPAGSGHNCTQTGEKQFKCNLCSYRGTEAETLKTHMLIHIGERLFKCDLCDYRCRTFEDLERHMFTHAGENRDKPLKCNICDYRCSFSAYLKKHMLTHTGEKPFKCDVCDYKCNQSWSLKRHMVRHTSKKPSKRNARNKKSGRSNRKS